MLVLSQAEKATLAAYGTPKNALKDVDIEPILESVTEEHADRVKSGLQGEFRVYPKSDGLYIVESMEDGKVKNTYSVNLKSGSGCSCRDYLMRCTGQNMSCKHIWRVRILVKLDALPGREQDSYRWMSKELYEDVKWIKSLDGEQEEFVDEIETLQLELDDDGAQNADYKYYIRERASILMQAKTADL